MAHEVFISYSRKDMAVADRICEAFDKAGISYFIDRQGISGGIDFPEVLANAIIECKVVLYLASKNSYASKFTNAELTFAFNEKSKNSVLPYIIDGSSMPPALRFVFAGVNWRNIKDHPIETTLVADILRMLGREAKRPKPTPVVPPQPKPTPPRPPRKPFNFAPLKRVLIAVVALLCIAGAVVGTVSYVKEQKRIAEQERINEEKRIAEEKRLAEQERLANEKRVAEEKNVAEENSLAGEKRVVEETRESGEKRVTTQRKGVYKVGDYFDDGKKQGVVFEVTTDGQHGKIVSLTESKDVMQWSSDVSECERLIGAEDKYNGAKNMAKVMQIEGWRNKYPAFAWCANLGNGWYLPAIEELKKFTIDDTIHNAVNNTLAKKGKMLANKGDKSPYWSSTEENRQMLWGNDEGVSKQFCVWYVYLGPGFAFDYCKGYKFAYVRAVSAF
ncbi:MAG: TIR domain-containing protein [Alistipes sp.]|nr:TIR domain-containing protein [Alistipes sp.]